MAARLLLRSLRRPTPGSSSPTANLAAGLLHRSPSPSPSPSPGVRHLHAILLRRGFAGSNSPPPKPPRRRIGLGTAANALSASFVCASAFPFLNQIPLPKWPYEEEERKWTGYIIDANLMVHVADVLSKRRLSMWGAKINSMISKGQIWRLATPALLHGGFLHITCNTLSLASIGPKVEEIAGPTRFLAIYCTSALSSSLMSYWFNPKSSVGASGAIFGLIGAQAVYLWRRREVFGEADLERIMLVLLINLGIGILARRIDNWAHLGGFLGGAAVEWFYGTDLAPPIRWFDQ